MNWAGIIAVCIASAGGIGGIVVAVIRLSSDIIANRLSQKYQLILNKELEEHSCNSLKSAN